MGFLEGLFVQTVPELPIAADLVTASGTVAAGYLYRVAGSDSPITLTIAPHPTTEGLRFAVKVVSEADTPPGGTLTVVVPAGQEIEADGGERGDGVELADQALGTYREWLCDADGVWIMVGGGW